MAGAGAAQAQVAADSADDAAGGLQEIVVTAQKRAQNIQQVGIAITAVTPEQIANRNIASSADLAGKVVGLESYSPYGPGTSSNVVIRGIGLNDFGEGHEAPVTSYVDDSTSSRSRRSTSRCSTSTGSRCCAVRKGRCSVATRLAA
ncbi:TonB-dependent receptor plug domain-containing protein [Rhizorhabdus histidinilytica]